MDFVQHQIRSRVYSSVILGQDLIFIPTFVMDFCVLCKTILSSK